MSDLVYTQYSLYLQEGVAIYSTALTPINNIQPQVGQPNVFFTASYTTVSTPAAYQSYRFTFGPSTYVYTFNTVNNGNVLIIPDDSLIQSFTGQVGIKVNGLSTRLLAFIPGGQQLPISFNTGVTAIGLYTSSGTDITATTAPSGYFSISVYCW